MNDRIQQEIIEENRIKRKELHEQRHKQFKSLIDEHNIDLKELYTKLHGNYPLDRLQRFYDGTEYITRNGVTERIISAINLMAIKKPKYEVISKVQIAILQRNGNLLLGKEIKKNLDELKSILSHLELDCRVIIAQDGCLIIENKKVFKTQFAKGKLI